MNDDQETPVDPARQLAARQRERPKLILDRGKVIWALAGTGLVICSLFNLAACPYAMSSAAYGSPGVVLFLAGVGILGGQIGALSLVLVWVNASYLWRLA
jgi:hypothetical protein